MKFSYLVGISLGIAAGIGLSLLLRQETATERAEYYASQQGEKFHKPNCRVLSQSTNRLAFGKRQDAIDKGYEPCGLCKP